MASGGYFEKINYRLQLHVAKLEIARNANKSDFIDAMAILKTFHGNKS